MKENYPLDCFLEQIYRSFSYFLDQAYIKRMDDFFILNKLKVDNMIRFLHHEVYWNPVPPQFLGEKDLSMVLWRTRLPSLNSLATK